MTENSPSAQFFYCPKCNKGVEELLEPHPNCSEQFKPVIRILGKDGFVARKLTCNHFISIGSEPIPDASSPAYYYTLGQIFPENELKEIRQEIMLQVSQMSHEELQKFIIEHAELYKLHLKAQQKEKYIRQVVEMEVEKRKSSMSKEQRMEFEYLDRKMTKEEFRSGEIAVKEKIKVERKIKDKQEKTNKALEKTREALAGIKGFSMEEIKERLGLK